jgi:6-phosphofructokinase 1
MNTTVRRIGILTSGGDAPGLNAVIRSVVKTAVIRYGWDVVGIVDGFEGLIGQPRIRPLGLADVSGLLPRGGSVLGCTNRGHFKLDGQTDPAALESAFQQAATSIKRLEIDAVIVVGGDGSQRIGRALGQRGVGIVGVPKTIDNDLAGTESTFGFETAVAFATDAIDRLHTTAESHGRVIVVEVMGREAGWIALYSGIAGGADVILIPEIPFTLEKATAKIAARAAEGKHFSIVVAAEGAMPVGGSSLLPTAGGGRIGPAHHAGIGPEVAMKLQQLTDREARAVVLGHLQRGGSPTASDRLLATAYGAAATRAIADGKLGHLVAWRGGRIQLVPITDEVTAARLVPTDHPLIETARGLGITFAGAADR